MALRKRNGKTTATQALFFVFFLLAMPALAQDAGPHKPDKTDKCPVCGMFVYKYPDWVGEIVFKDGSRNFFDGAKDMFKYYFHLKKYNPEKSRDDIAACWVTEYYDMKVIEAEAAYFVVGSDVYGPMGHELIPFANREDAETFKKDHKGRVIVTFDQINPEMVFKLDE